MKKKTTRKNGKTKSGTPSRPNGQTHGALWRKMEIHEKIQNETYPNAETLAKELGKTARTIK